MQKNSILVLMLFCFAASYAQSELLPLNNNKSIPIERAFFSQNENSFLSIKPIIKSDLSDFFRVDSVWYKLPRDQKLISKFKHPVWWKKLRTDDLIHYAHPNLSININPIINFSIGKSGDTQSLMVNTRGFDLYGSLGKHIYFVSGFYENQAFFPTYYSQFVKDNRVVPGQGRMRIYKDRGFDYSQSYGFVFYKPVKAFGLQIGHGKTYIGDGYRSVIMSDESFNMPYFKLVTTLSKFRITHQFNLYQNARNEDGNTEIHNRRYGSTISLSYIMSRFAEFSLIESIVWKGKQENHYMPSLVAYSPLPFTNTIAYGMDYPTANALIGVNLRFKISKGVVAYGQWLADGEKKQAYQVGLKLYNIGKLPLFARIELNHVDEAVYTSSDYQSYVNYNQFIAHPLGNDFDEIIGELNTELKDFTLQYRIQLASSSSYEILAINYSNFDYSTEKLSEPAQIQNHEFSISFLVNPAYNLRIYGTYRHRNVEFQNINIKESFYFLGIKSSMVNQYDFF
ncbi:MAG: hypothetical protein JXR60_06725 [Bacteroidales bacterium]|nr:hypothetical protein [Bacteroidales bacterium]